MRTSRLVAAVVALAPLMAAASSAMALPQRHTVTRRLVWTYQQSQPAIGTSVCDAGGACILPFTITGGPASTGDVAGTTVQAGSASVLPDGTVYANSIITFTGTILGCGTGTVTMRSTGLNKAGTTSGRVVIVAGSGTAELTGITGSGKVVDGHADPSGSDGGTGTIHLRVRCRPG
ncbi:MAG: DUF3224 domain-containing protein [Ilumatobacteraceae bacterium]